MLCYLVARRACEAMLIVVAVAFPEYRVVPTYDLPGLSALVCRERGDAAK